MSGTVPRTRHVKVKIVSAASAAALETAVNAWFAGSGESAFLSIQVEAYGTDLTATITYCD